MNDDRGLANVIYGYEKNLPPLNPKDRGHYHPESSEFWLIMAGQIRYPIEGQGVVIADEGDVVYVPMYTFHAPRFHGAGTVLPAGDERVSEHRAPAGRRSALVPVSRHRSRLRGSAPARRGAAWLSRLRAKKGCGILMNSPRDIRQKAISRRLTPMNTNAKTTGLSAYISADLRRQARRIGMDQLTHTATGLFLSRAGLDRLTPYAAPILMLAANAPDIDIVAAARRRSLNYLNYHRHLTHSVFMLPLMALLPVLLVRLFARRPLRWGGRVPDLRHRAWPATWLLDATNVYGVRLLLPFLGALVPSGYHQRDRRLDLGHDPAGAGRRR